MVISIEGNSFDIRMKRRIEMWILTSDRYKQNGQGVEQNSK